MTTVEQGPLRLLLQLQASSRFAVTACTAVAGPYVLVQCPAGLSLVAAEVEALDGLASAVMEARAALLQATGQVWRCGEDTPDELERSYTGLGIGWRDVPPRSKREPLVLVDLSADGPEWLTTDEAAAALGIAVNTLKTAWVTNGVGPTRHRVDGRFVYRRGEVIAVRDQRRVA